jgi:Ca-activated chloride channel family protein
MSSVDGTAIGSAIVTATNRLKDSEAKSKIIILITDGANNIGEVDPITAGELQKALE